MINFLTGSVHHKSAESLTLLVGGVGYEIFLGPSQLEKTNPGSQLELHIHSHIREDSFTLFGFSKIEELNLFKLLIGVSGVGPKTALIVIDNGVENAKSAIVNADETFFTKIPRLGKKNAQKIIIELKPKIGSLVDLDLSGNSNNHTDLLQALESMGFTKAEALAKIKTLPNESLALDQQLRFVLSNKTVNG